jgi:hypothetical protein
MEDRSSSLGPRHETLDFANPQVRVAMAERRIRSCFGVRGIRPPVVTLVILDY